MNEREMLETYMKWLQDDVIPGFQRQLEAHTIGQDSVNRAVGHLNDILWRLETDPPRPAPICGWKKPYKEHGIECPKHYGLCNKRFQRWQASRLARNLSQVSQDLSIETSP